MLTPHLAAIKGEPILAYNGAQRQAKIERSFKRQIECFVIFLIADFQILYSLLAQGGGYILRII